MDPTTELASNFTVARYHELRQRLAANDHDEDAWTELLDALERRVQERFLRPIEQLAGTRQPNASTVVPGFAILALDCLLIDTIQSFREGRVTTGDASPAHSFKTFLSAPSFAVFSRRDRDDFFHYVRNGILHNGETRGGWKIRIDTRTMLERDPATGTRIINRELLHEAVNGEFVQLLATLRFGKDQQMREQFLRRMDAIAEYPPAARKHAYFAYGSNLDQAEITKTAPDAQDVGVAYLPCYRVIFTKHADTRGGDAATITPDPNSVVWGYVYRITDDDKKALEAREAGYDELLDATVQLLAPNADPTPVRAFTFIARESCPKHCGPSTEYLGIVVKGAMQRQLPPEYTEQLKATGERAHKD